jgi:hypothetical protein
VGSRSSLLEAARQPSSLPSSSPRWPRRCLAEVADGYKMPCVTLAGTLETRAAALECGGGVDHSGGGSRDAGQRPGHAGGKMRTGVDWGG